MIHAARIAFKETSLAYCTSRAMPLPVIAAAILSSQSTQISNAAAKSVGNYNRNDGAKSPTGILSAINLISSMERLADFLSARRTVCLPI